MSRERSWMVLVLGLIAIATATSVFVPGWTNGARGVRPLALFEGVMPMTRRPFEVSKSAALFVGIRKFQDPEMTELKYSVDDAVDLAYTFALDRRVALVPPQRVVLALSGEPLKPASKQRLAELRNRGAQVDKADQSTILRLLKQQATIAGREGLFIAAFATHGFVHDDGVPYVLGSTSLFQYPETSVSGNRIFDIAARFAARSLILIDACRERANADTRGVAGAPARTIERRMNNVDGQVVFYAAPSGGYSYEGDGNGIFTQAVLHGLRCTASAPRGQVTAETLRTFVDREVTDWVRKNRDPNVTSSIQVIFDGDAHDMPLAQCWETTMQGPVPPPVADVTSNGDTLIALDAQGGHAWEKNLGSRIVRTKLVDLQSDGVNRIVVGVRGNAEKPGNIRAFDADGAPLWSIEEPMRLRAVVVSDLFHKHQQHVVALWTDERTGVSRLAIYDRDGKPESSYEHRGALERIAVDGPTNRHLPRIIVAGVEGRSVTLMAFWPKNLKPRWARLVRPAGASIEDLQIVDCDDDDRRDIKLFTAGKTLAVDFDGKEIQADGFELQPLRKPK